MFWSRKPRGNTVLMSYDDVIRTLSWDLLYDQHQFCPHPTTRAATFLGGSVALSSSRMAQPGVYSCKYLAYFQLVCVSVGRAVHSTQVPLLAAFLAFSLRESASDIYYSERPADVGVCLLI